MPSLNRIQHVGSFPGVAAGGEPAQAIGAWRTQVLTFFNLVRFHVLDFARSSPDDKAQGKKNEK